MSQTTDNIFARTEALIGSEALNKLAGAKVALFGIGGVGSYTAEALARSGIGHIVLVDKDRISLDNINRQIPALTSTVGRPKVEVMAERIRDINPSASVIPREEFFLPENSDRFDFTEFDYVIDAIDTVTAKIELAVRCSEAETPLISCMGTGNKLDPGRFLIADIYETSVCPLCKVMRKELKKRKIDSLKVLYSTEEPLVRRRTPASIAFVPPVAGLMLAREVVKSLAAI